MKKKRTCKYCNSENLIMREINEQLGLYCKDCDALISYLTRAEMRKLRGKGYELEGYFNKI